ncbi:MULTISPECIES: sensor histidine kinase [Metabacillus]|uniref:Histidine kinase n=2 Tax=Metabacillus TaxID=2675233 RepID=A0ABX6RZE4_9BACI|nr:hypothetical protein [Metabacillus sp. KUDC1714]QNF26823.1 hypothetical protein HUW50_04265 [Metabacillus sp. KUDC1714]
MNINIKQEVIDAHIIENYENELKGISIFLHEGIAQNLYAVFNHLQYLQQHIVDKDDRSTIDDMVILMKRTIEDVRVLSNDIHPFSHKGIDGALTTLLNSFSKKHNISIHYQGIGEKQRLPLLSELIVYRTFKDLLTMVALHSPPLRIKVTSFWGEAVEIDVELTWDNQTTFQHEKFLLDILGFEKKLKLVGGAFNVTSPFDPTKVVNLLIKMNVR